MQAGTFRKFTLLLGVATIICIHRRLQETGGQRASHACRPSACGSAADGDALGVACDDQPGDSTTLSWTSTDATDADIEPGVGKVARARLDAGEPHQLDDLHHHGHGSRAAPRRPPRA